jgi:capsular polysaccharide biosynthesis protein
MNDFFSYDWIFRVIRKRFIHFVIIGTAAILLSAFFSSPQFITPKFRATARVYPSNLGEMSEESYTEQMLEIMKSVDIKLRIFDAFRLDTVYRISRDDPKYLSYMLGIYDKHVHTAKTEFETVEISVLDKEPKRAAAMCDSLIHFYNEKVREMHSAKNWELVKVLQDDIAKRLADRDSIQQLLDRLRTETRVFDIVAQEPEITRGYMRALTGGNLNTADRKEIKTIYDNLMDKGSEIHILERRFESLLQAINELRVSLDKSLSEARKKISYAHIVQRPLVPDDKAYPVRWVIVSLTLASTLFLALLVFAFIDSKKITRE